MRALVVYESMFGNTQLIANAIGDGLGELADVTLVEVGQAPQQVDRDIALLVVGGPTHALGLSSPRTRASAAEQTPTSLVSPGTGVREWLSTVHADPAYTLTAAFDTRTDKRWVPGAASAKIHRTLARKGLRSAAKARSFYVSGTEGPLLGGEVERARSWGAQLARELGSTHPTIPHR